MLALAGGKGGCGKTTTTLGLAAALDGPGVVVDADRAMPNLHALAEVPRHPTLADLAAPDGGGTDSVVLDEVAHPYPEDASVSVVTAPAAGQDCDLAAALTRLGAATDAPVLVDCPAGAGPDAAAPLRAADRTLLVGTLCAPGLRDTAKTAAMARALGTPVHGAVLTRTRLAPDAVTRLLDCPVVVSVPRAGAPVLADDGVRAAYVRLADWVQSEESIL